MGEARDIETLVQTVTDLVLAGLEGAARGPAARPGPDGSSRAAATSRPAGDAGRGAVLVVLPVPPARPADLALALDDLVRQGWRVRGTGSPEALPAMDRRPANVVWKPLATPSFGDDAAGRRDVVVLGSLGFAFARRLAELDDDDPVVRLAARALLDGRKVVALSDDLRGGGAVAQEAASRLQAVERLGIEVRRTAELEGVLGRLAEAGATVARAAGGLLTEADVVRLREAGETRLVLPPRTIVTPLARSKATELGLELEEGG